MVRAVKETWKHLGNILNLFPPDSGFGGLETWKHTSIGGVSCFHQTHRSIVGSKGGGND